MSQQINLLNPALIKQKDLLNSNNMAITLGLLSALMLGYYGYAQKQLSLLTMQRNQVAEELTGMQAQLKQTALLHAPHELNKALLDQIVQLEQKEAMQQQVLQTVNLSSATPEKGYAALMRAFAKQSIDGLWLTSFSIDSNTERLNISGRTLQADLVPEYISRLGNEPALKGKLFSALNMSLPKADPLANGSPAVPTNSAPDILAASASIVKNGKSITPSNPTAQVTQSSEPKYIEFSLQSIDEKAASNTDTSKLGGKS
jgi:hypothetical protein